MVGSETFQLKLKNENGALETLIDAEIDKKLDKVVETFRDVGMKFYRTQNIGKRSKLSS